MATQLIIPRQLDANGDAASGAKALVYQTGTTTPVTVYTDTALSVAHASPIVANSAGYFAQAFYGGSTALKVVVTDSADATLVTYDPVPLVSLSSSAASDVTHAPTTENTATDVQTAIDNLSDGTATFTGFTSDTGGVIATADIVDGAVTRAKMATPPGFEFIATFDASTSASLDFAGFDATKYESYIFKIKNVIPSANNAILIRVSTDGGSTFISTANYEYSYSFRNLSATATLTETGAAGGTFISVGPAAASTGGGASYTVNVLNAGETSPTVMDWSGVQESSSGGLNWERSTGGAVYTPSAAVDAVQFYPVSGTLTSGTITMYGLRNS